MEEQEHAEYIRRQMAKAALWRRPCLEEIGAQLLRSTFEEMYETCAEVRYNMQNNYQAAVSLFDDDDELMTEFIIAFAEIENDIEKLSEYFDYDTDYGLFTEEVLELRERDYDDATVIMFGGARRIMGYDEYEDDYFRVENFQADAAVKNAQKRIMRHTKQEILNICRKAGTKALEFLDLQMRYNSLKGTMDLMRGETAAIVSTLKEIDEMWKEAQEVGWGRHGRAFDALLESLPERIWLE